jgi:hypothetical protein
MRRRKEGREGELQLTYIRWCLEVRGVRIHIVFERVLAQNKSVRARHLVHPITCEAQAARQHAAEHLHVINVRNVAAVSAAVDSSESSHSLVAHNSSHSSQRTVISVWIARDGK